MGGGGGGSSIVEEISILSSFVGIEKQGTKHLFVLIQTEQVHWGSRANKSGNFSIAEF